MAKMSQTQMMKMAALRDAVKKASTKELIAEVVHAALPQSTPDLVISTVGSLTAGVVTALVLDPSSLVSTVASVMLGAGAAEVGGGVVRSGITAREEWKELGRRVYRSIVPEKKMEKLVCVVQDGVTPLVSTPELVAQAVALNGRRI